jgi:hypothetical protein
MPVADEIDHATLGRLDFIAEGGQGKVYSAPELTVPGVTGDLVYKEYKRNQVASNGLRAIVGMRSRLSTADRQRLDSMAAWPICTVQKQSVVSGIVMPKIPATFFEARTLPTGRQKDMPREVQNLFVSAAKCRRLGLPLVNLYDRFAVCRDLAAALAFLHDNNVVFGDVNAKNALFRVPGDPTVMLVDCDAVRVKGSAAVVKQLNSPDWEPPEGSTLTVHTDVYKFALFIVRTLSPGDFASTVRDPVRVRAVLDDEGWNLLTNSLAESPSRRPDAQAWVAYFSGRTRSAPGGSQVGASAAGWPAHNGWRRDPSTGRWVEASL